MLRWFCLGMALRVLTWPLGYIVIVKSRQVLFFAMELAWTLVKRCAVVGVHRCIRRHRRWHRLLCVVRLPCGHGLPCRSAAHRLPLDRREPAHRGHRRRGDRRSLRRLRDTCIVGGAVAGNPCDACEPPLQRSPAGEPRHPAPPRMVVVALFPAVCEVPAMSSIDVIVPCYRLWPLPPRSVSRACLSQADVEAAGCSIIDDASPDTPEEVGRRVRLRRTHA